MAPEWATAFIAGQEWIVIVILAAILIFGAKKIPELAKTLGRSRGEYEKGKMEGDRELAEFKEGKRGGGDDRPPGAGDSRDPNAEAAASRAQKPPKADVVGDPRDP